MKRVLVTGAGGLVGTAVCNSLRARNYDVVALQSRTDCDLTDQSAVSSLMKDLKPTFVCHLAASVFGVGGNLKFPADVFFGNTLMNTLLIEAARQVGVTKFVAMGSAAIYADGLSQPMNEGDAMTGEPHGSEYAYAMSKRAMLVQLEAYRAQYAMDYSFVIATNMYGPHDKFDVAYGHVVPSLLKKFLDAESSGQMVEIWGDGTPTRDFLYCADAGEGIAMLLETGQGRYNLATGQSVSIADLVQVIAREFPSVRYAWNSERPNGQLCRSYDVDRIASLGFVPKHSLVDGIAETVRWLRQQQGGIRQ